MYCTRFLTLNAGALDHEESNNQWLNIIVMLIVSVALFACASTLGGLINMISCALVNISTSMILYVGGQVEYIS